MNLKDKEEKKSMLRIIAGSMLKVSLLISLAVFSLEILLGRQEINNSFNHADHRRYTGPEEQQIDQPGPWFAQIEFMGAEVSEEYRE